VAIETLPAVVLQLTLLIASPNNWTSPELLISLSISIVAAAVLMVDAESSMYGVAGASRRYIEYFGYLPLTGSRRAMVLVSLTFFMAGYLVLAASSIAVAVQLVPLWTVAMVLVADCGLHHLTRAADGEWWIIGNTDRSGLGPTLADTVVQTVMWIVTHACPLLCTRDPDVVGPHAALQLRAPLAVVKVPNPRLEVHNGAAVRQELRLVNPPRLVQPKRVERFWRCPRVCLPRLGKLYRTWNGDY
jgi:hypothetical protein